MKGNFILHCCLWCFCLISSTEGLPKSQGFDLNLYHFLKTPKITPVDLNSVCVYNEIVYLPNENFTTDNPCEICVCNPPGYACALKSCDIKPGCKTLQKANKCCPEYVCECELNGKIYGNGEKVEEPNPCKVCYCKGGEIKCALITCYSRNDCEPVYIEGRCCPKYDDCPLLEIKNNSASLKPTPVVISDLTPLEFNHVLKANKPESDHTKGDGSSVEYTSNNNRTVIDFKPETTSEKFSSSENISVLYEDSETSGNFSTTETTTFLKFSTTEFYEESETDGSDLKADGSEFSELALDFSNTKKAATEEETSSMWEVVTEKMVEGENPNSLNMKTYKSQRHELNAVMETTTVEPETFDIFSSENLTTQKIYTKNSLGDSQVTEELIAQNFTETISLEKQEATTNIDELTLILQQSINSTKKSEELEMFPVETNTTSNEEIISARNLEEEDADTETENPKPDLDNNVTFSLNLNVDANPAEEFSAPGLKMLSAEQIQFLHVGEEPPVYVSPILAATTDSKADTQPDIIVLPNTTPVTVEMTKVVEKKNPSSRNGN